MREGRLNTRTKGLIAIVVVAVVVTAGVLSYIVFTAPASGSMTSGSPAGCTVATASSTGPPVAGNLTQGNWTTYHGTLSRNGFLPMTGVSSVHQQWGGSVGLDGQVYAEPLTCGNAIFVATEDDSVYALNATNGNILWKTNLGTPVPGAALPCGDIDPSGVTGTPAIDVATGTIYAVAFLNPGQHVLFGLSIHIGSVLSHVVVDAAGANPLVEQQRGALLLDNGVVYVPYGGLDGDCGQYHGWVVGARTNGSGTLLSYQVPTGREGGIWGTAGIALGPNGNLYIATGNSEATTTFDFGDAVIELSPSLAELSYFAPTNWAKLNVGDIDLGSVAPTILPNGDIFQIGKEGVGYLLSGADLGGIGGQLFNETVCAGGYGGTATVGQSVLVPCDNGLVKVVVGAANFTLAWQDLGFNSGSPIVTGDIVWAVNISTAHLVGVNLSTGQSVYSFALGSVDHFITPGAAPGTLLVGAGNQLYSFALDGP
ncbi:MAG: PQQ-binding-like beta-propeller repeat protein [Thermoplasmata archaeon]